MGVEGHQYLADSEGLMRRFLCVPVTGVMLVMGFGHHFANARAEDCPQHFVGGKPPALETA